MTIGDDWVGVQRDAHLLDALAAGQPVDDPAVALLGSLRRTLDRPARVPVRRRGRRRRAVAGFLLAFAIPVLALTVGTTSAHPGDLLYPVRSHVLGRTADDPHDAAALLSRAATMTRHLPRLGHGSALTTSQAALALVALARHRLLDLEPRDAVRLDAEADRIEEALRTPRPSVRGTRQARGRATVVPAR